MMDLSFPLPLQVKTLKLLTKCLGSMLNMILIYFISR